MHSNNEPVTAVCIPLPPENHPIWRMGFKHVEVAHALCSAFLAISRR